MNTFEASDGRKFYSYSFGIGGAGVTVALPANG